MVDQKVFAINLDIVVLYTPIDWSFISVQFFVINSLFRVLFSKFIIFNIPVLYYHTNLNSSIICCLYSGDIYLSFGISVLLLASSSREDFFERFIFLSAILFPISFLNCSFWSSFYCICCRFLSTIKVLTILIVHDYVFSNFSCICINAFSN